MGEKRVLAGADSCSAGWVAAIGTDVATPRIRVYSDFRALMNGTRHAALVLVDVPIGLPESVEHADRQCDLIARALVGPRRSSVYPAPSRQALHGATREAADRLNKAAIGKGIGAQHWGLHVHVAVVDRHFIGDPSLQDRVREIHPEVCFAALNGWAGLPTPKRDMPGLLERRALLRRHVPTLDAIDSQSRRGVATNDLYDALVAYVTAHLALKAGVPTIPVVPEHDSRGLRLEMILPFPPPTDAPWLVPSGKARQRHGCRAAALANSPRAGGARSPSSEVR